MKLSPKQKKWGKRLLIFLGIRIILGLVFFYVIDYRFKDLIQFAVKNKSNHAYAFDSGEIEVSVFKKNLTIKNAVLYATDTLHAKGHYKVKLKEVYFAMNSWKELIFHQRLVVDSVKINSPLIFYHEHERTLKTKKYPHVEDIDGLLHRLLKHLRVKAFHISNASYAFKSKLHPAALNVNNINFSLRNFSDLSPRENLLDADEIELKVEKQQINLPDGIHSMAFSHLQFSGRKKYFQLDSFSFVAKAVSGKAAINISATKLRLKSAHIADIFRKDELNIDTVEIFKPVITMKGSAGPHHHPADLKINHIFNLVRFKFIKVEQGGFARQAGLASGAKYGSNHVDLRVYDLQVEPAIKNSLQIRRVKLDADKLNFKSEDGKTELSVDEMAFDHNSVIFLNATYGAVNPKMQSVLSFKAPLLKLQNVGFTALLNKRIIAEQADLASPVIHIRSFAKPDTAAGNKTDFSDLFKMFHTVKDLFVVKRFNIKNGALILNSKVKNATKISVEKLNASILADKMLNSDTTLEIKHAIPMLSFKRMKVSSPKLNLNLSDYVFYGKVRHNTAKSLNVKINGGPVISAKHLYWEWLDWDLYRSERMIFIDSMKIRQLHVAVNSSSKSKKTKKPLLKIHLGRLDINQLHFDVNRPDVQAKFMGRKFFAREVDSRLSELEWLDIGGEFEQLYLNNKKMSLTASKLILHTEGNNRMEKVSLRSESGRNPILNVAALDFKARLSSTKLKPYLDYLIFHDPEIYISNKKTSVAKPIPSIAAGLEVREIIVKNGKLYNQMLTDSLLQNPISRFDFIIRQLKGYGNASKVLSAKSFDAEVKSLEFANQSFKISAPVSFKFNDFEIFRVDSVFRLSGKLIGRGENLALNYRKENSFLDLSNMSMSLDDPAFSLDIGRKLNWQQFIDKLTIKDGGVNFQNANSRIIVNNLSWLPKRSFLRAKGIRYEPLLSTEAFKIKNPWQSDYIEAAAGTLTAEGINFSGTTGQHELNVSSITLDSLKLNSSRDKRMNEPPFKEKPMPTQLISDLKIPLLIQEIKVTNSQVNIRETSLATGKEGMITLSDIDATIFNVNSRQTAADSMKLIGQAGLFGKTRIKLNYRESYQDSISAFNMKLSISPMDLREISEVSIPLAALKINRGDADGINAQWEGNKFMASGEILLPYKNLRINVMDRKNLNRESLLLRAENDLVNMILRKKNHKPSFMFFERNRNKFVFNYWIKTLLTGFASSVGLKSERTLKKKEEAFHSKYKFITHDRLLIR